MVLTVKMEEMVILVIREKRVQLDLLDYLGYQGPMETQVNLDLKDQAVVLDLVVRQAPQVNLVLQERMDVMVSKENVVKKDRLVDLAILAYRDQLEI